MVHLSLGGSYLSLYNKYQTKSRFMKLTYFIRILVCFLVSYQTISAQDKYPLVLTITDSKGVQIEESIQISVNGKPFVPHSPHQHSNIQLAYNEQPMTVQVKGNYFLCGWKFHHRMKELNITVGDKRQEYKIKGIIRDAAGNTFFDFSDNFNILVNEKYYFSDSPQGDFTIGIKKGVIPSRVQTLSPYFFLQDWWFNPQTAQLFIVVSNRKPISLRGIIYDGKGQKLENIKVEIAGIRQPAYSNKDGKFTMNLPAHLTLNRNSTITVNGRTVSSDNFMTKKKKGTIYLKMRVLDPIESARGVTKKRIDKAPNNLDTQENNSQQEKIDIADTEVFAFEEDSIPEKSVNQIDTAHLFEKDINQIINLLEAEKHNLTLSSNEIRRRIKELSNQLTNKQLSNNQKSRLEKELHRLEKQLINNDLAYENAQIKTHGLLMQMAEIVLRKDSLKLANNSLYQKYKTEKAERQKDWLLFVIIGILLVGFTITSFIFGRKHRQQHQKIEKQNLQLEKQKEEILDKNKILENQSHKIQHHHKVMTDSIHAARYVQEAMLPVSKGFQQNFMESFIFYQPQNIISGDFYHLEKFGDKIIVSVADCTGHGVQGALLSVLGMNELTKIIQSGITQPNQILQELHQSFNQNLHHDPSRTEAGIDMGICVIDKSKNTLSFAGAKNPLIYVQEGKLNLIKANRQSIGGLTQNSDFKMHTLDITPSSYFYMASDGFQDQFGGKRNRKFMTTHFRNLLLKVHEHPAQKQAEMLKNTLQEWQGTQEQTDDILVLGFKV